MDNYAFAHARVEEFEGSDIGVLLKEISGLRGIPIHGLVIHVLDHALYPHGDGKRIAINKAELKTEYFLPMKVRKLLESDIYRLCIDLVAISGGGHIENYHGVTLFTFLNRTVPKNQKPSKLKKKSRYGR